MNWRSLIGGVVLVIVIGIAGLIYRNMSETVVSNACTEEAKICPDGSGVGRTGPSCSFAPCLPPNVELAVGSSTIAYVLPAGYVSITEGDEATIASYGAPTGVASSTEHNSIIVRRYLLPAATTAVEIIHKTAINDPSGMPASPAAFSSVTLGSYRYTTVSLGRFEGVVHTVYYLAREQDVLRFDAIDRGVLDWTDPALDIKTLPANTSLRTLLGTLTQ